MGCTTWQGFTGATLVAGTLALFSPGAQAASDNILIGAGSGNGPSTTTSYNLQNLGGGTFGWIVDEPVIDHGGHAPVPVYLDPSAGPWLKNLSFLPPIGEPRADSAPNSRPSPQLSFTLQEYLKVGDDPAWTDWHESASLMFPTVDSPTVKSNSLNLLPTVSFSHVQVSAFDQNSSSFQPLDANVKTYDHSVGIWFDNPLPVGTILQVTKQVNLSASIFPRPLSQLDGQTNGFALPYLQVAEYPTSTVPMPASAWMGFSLLGVVVIMMGVKRRQAAA